ncbi:hypothetical protein [Streptomyces sp. RP5T]|uniref:hypothetical protein n=1 Tax=Streptomyces sp. RP5T TaxID=2490848 RepID=UPI000F6508D2|nr:hypothetical protein [Streptomyces sp. RP5T]RRR85964.1 hypothetical protein EHS43_05985 [Streptomyces sp. RP5T]
MKIRKNLAARTLGIGAAAAACLMLTTGVAEAGSFGPKAMVDTNGVKRGTAQFVANGDTLTVCDTRADGFAPKVSVYYANTNTLVWRVTANLGKGFCVKSSKNLGERTRYDFWATGLNQRLYVGTAG